jgi:hypothetical protein
MREAYDETDWSEKAIELGLARTGKLVTSAALILMFAFLVLSSTPGLRSSCSRSAPGSFRRDRDPCTPRPGTDAPPRQCQLVAAALEFVRLSTIRTGVDGSG